MSAKKRNIILGVVAGLVLVIGISVIIAPKRNASSSADSGEVTDTVPEKETEEMGSSSTEADTQPQSETAPESAPESTEPETETEPSSTQPLSSSEDSTGPQTTESTGSDLPSWEIPGIDIGREETVPVDSDDRVDIKTITDKETGKEVTLAGTRLYKWLEQPGDSTAWTIAFPDISINAYTPAKHTSFLGLAFDDQVYYVVTFRMLERDENPWDFPDYPVRNERYYKEQGYTVDYWYRHWDSLTAPDFFGTYTDFIGFTTRIAGSIMYSENASTGMVYVDQAYTTHSDNADYFVQATIHISTTKELYEKLSSGELEIDDKDSLLYAIFSGAAEKYPDIPYPLGRYLTIDVFGNGTRLYWENIN